MTLPPSLVALASLGVAGVVVLLVWLRGNATRAQTGRSMLRSIPEGISRAKRNKRHVLVFFVDPKDALTPAVLDTAFDPSLAIPMGSFERVRVDAHAGDLDVVSHVAQKYGLPSVEPPTLLALDSDGRRIEALVGKDATGSAPGDLRERVRVFLERARARF